MDLIKNKDFNNICRICLLTCDMKFSLDHVIYDIYIKLSDGIPFETNELPQQICMKCSEKINEIHKFSIQCKEANSCLTKCLEFKNVQIKEEIVTTDEHKIEFVGVEELQIKQETIDETSDNDRNSVHSNENEEMSHEITNKNDETILVKAIKGNESLLPNKSKQIYDKEYDKFQCWMVDNSVEIINETIVFGYFKELSESFTPNSLWTKYSMLKKTLLVNKNINIGNFHNLVEYLKQGSKGYEGKKSTILSRDQVLKFVHEAPNQIYLMAKVALLFVVFGGCRRQELVNMLVEHIEDRHSVIVVNVLDTKTGKKRVFTIIEESEMGCLKLIREYANLRPHGCSEKRFFLTYKNGRCTVQPVGKNTFGKIPTTIATFLNLSDAKNYRLSNMKNQFS